MALLIGDFVICSEGAAASTFPTHINQVIQATSGNLTHLQSLVDAGLASIIGSPSKRYIALITQSGTDAPVATVLRNTLSDAPVWARSSQGVYTLTLTGEFTVDKTLTKAVITALGSGNEFQADLQRTSANVLTLSVRDFGGNAIDGFTAAVEIEVYG